MQKVSATELNDLLRNIDVYLLDQLLKGRFEQHHEILDAGCGQGRNLMYFVRNGYRVFGFDKNKDVIHILKNSIESIDSSYPTDRFITANVEDLPYPDHKFDAIISVAVLHFAENEDHFFKMASELVRVLKPGGILFVRMACDIGMEDQMKPMGTGTYFLPDGSIRFLLSKTLLQQTMEKYGFEFIEPFKTVVIDNQRSMSVLVLRKV